MSCSGVPSDLTDVTDKLVDMRFLQQTQLTHAGERVKSFVDDELLSVAQTLLEERLQDGGALPADVRCHTFNTTQRKKGRKLKTQSDNLICPFINCGEKK